MDISFEVTGLIAIIVSTISALGAYWKAQRRKTTVFFEKLFEQFTQKVFTTGDNQNEDTQIEQTLLLLSQVCYYKTAQLITEKQFNIFENALRQYLARPNVQRHMRNRLNELKEDEESSAYSYLSSYMPESGIAITDEDIESKASVDCEKVSFEGFYEPTMIFKVSRLYREGMSTEEVYNITRQWWRVNSQRAQKMRYALGVAHGIVKEVFAIDSWRCGGEEDECPGRWCFEGRVADESIRKRFVNKSVKHLFKKGEMSPIRYFDGH